MSFVSQKLRRSAQGEECTLQIVGICNGNPETTVLAHLPDDSHGMGMKADDFCACFACSDCHDWLDRRVKFGELVEAAQREWYMRRAMVRTWRRWKELGLVKFL